MTGKVRDRREYYQKNKERISKKNSEWQKNNKEAKKLIVVKHKLKKHNATLDDFVRVINEQDYSCAICKSKFDLTRQFPDIDHDHGTNEFRGLLCRQCNLGLGYFYDNEDSLLNAIEYLRINR